MVPMRGLLPVRTIDDRIEAKSGDAHAFAHRLLRFARDFAQPAIATDAEMTRLGDEHRARIACGDFVQQRAKRHPARIAKMQCSRRSVPTSNWLP